MKELQRAEKNSQRSAFAPPPLPPERKRLTVGLGEKLIEQWLETDDCAKIAHAMNSHYGERKFDQALHNAVSRRYQTLARQGEFEKINQLADLTGINPDYKRTLSAEVTALYQNIFDRPPANFNGVVSEFICSIDAVFQHAQVEPDWSRFSSGSKNWYAYLLEHNHAPVQDIEYLRTRTACPPDYLTALRPNVKRAIIKALSEYRYRLASELFNLIIEQHAPALDMPVLDDPDIIQALDEAHLRSLLDRDTSNVTLKFASRYVPDPKKLELRIQTEVYASMIQDYAKMSFLDNVWYSTGIKPDFNGTLAPHIRATALQCLRQGSFSNLSYYSKRLLAVSNEEYSLSILSQASQDAEVADCLKQALTKAISSGEQLMAISTLVSDDLLSRPEYSEAVQTGWRIFFGSWLAGEADLGSDIFSNYGIYHFGVNVACLSPNFKDETIRTGIQAFYARLLEKGSAQNLVQNLVRCIQMTGIKPAPETLTDSRLNQLATHLLQTNRFADLKNLTHSTARTPDCAGQLKSLHKSRCLNLLRQRKYDALFDELIPATAKFDWKNDGAEALHEAMDAAIRNGRMKDLELLEERTSISVNWHDHQAALAKLQRKWIRCGAFNSLKELEEKTSLPLDYAEHQAETLKTLTRWLERGELNKIRTLLSATGLHIDPVRDATALQQGYGTLFKEENFHALHELVQLSGVKLDLADIAADIQALYAKYLSRFDSCTVTSLIHKIKQLGTLTGIRPDITQLTADLDTAVLKILELQTDDVFLDWSGLDFIQQELGHRPAYDQAAFKNSIVGLIVSRFQRHNSVYIVLQEIKEITRRTGVLLADPIIADALCTSTNFIIIHGRAVGDVLRARPAEFQAFRHVAHQHLGSWLERRAWPCVESLCLAFDLKPDQTTLKREFAEELARGSVDPDLVQLMHRFHLHFEHLTAEDVEKMPFKDPRTTALMIKLFGPQEPAKRRAFLEAVHKKDGWLGLVPDLLEIRGPAGRQDLCPWKTQLAPLIKTYFDATPPPLSPQDANIKKEAFLDFIRRFGMNNLPNLARTIHHLVHHRHNIQDASGTQVRTTVPFELRTFWETHGLRHTLSELKSPEDIEQIINELEQSMHRLAEQILQDELPGGLEQSPLDLELFNAVVVNSQHAGGTWGQLRERPRHIATWRKMATYNHLTNRDTRLPYGYEPEILPVKRASSEHTTPTDPSPADAALTNEEQAALQRGKRQAELRQGLERIRTKEPFVKFLQPFMDSAQTLERFRAMIDYPPFVCGPLLERLNEEKTEREAQRRGIDPSAKPKQYAAVQKSIEELARLLDLTQRLSQPSGPQVIIQNELESLRLEHTQREAEHLSALASVTDEAARRKHNASHRTWMDFQAERIHKLDALISAGQNQPDPYLKIQMLIEALRITFGKDAVTIAGPELRLLCLELMRQEQPEYVETAIQAGHAADGQITDDVRRAWGELFLDQLLMHFLNPEHVHQDVRRVPFTSELTHILESTWRINQKRPALVAEIQRAATADGTSSKGLHPMLDAALEAKIIEREQANLANAAVFHENEPEKVRLGFYPVHGLGRIFSGDVGGSCHADKAEYFAKNEYPDMQAVLFAESGGKKRRQRNARLGLLGSCLLIEAKDTEGRSNLIIRGLNPTEPAIQRLLDPDDFLAKMIDYAIATAKRRGLDRVRMCKSEVRRHATNRDQVAGAMDRAIESHAWKGGSELVSKPETLFKYDITPSSETVIVWERATS